MLKIGSHVSVSGKGMLVDSVNTSIENGANSLMIYTGAPQNTKRRDISEFRIEEAIDIMNNNDISIDDVIIHAPYIINLGNTLKPETYEIATEFLAKEIERTEQIGAKYIVLHPGAHVGAGVEAGLNNVVKGLNEVLKSEQNVIVCLETMSGKGTELGVTFEELAFIIENVDLNDKLGVCLDTCHIHDAGYDMTDFNKILDKFDDIIGLDRLKVIHVNDSKNVRGASKDRHANIGYGEIGFDSLIDVFYDDRTKNITKILETPYVDKVSPYKNEIEMIKNKEFSDWIENNTKENS